MTFAPFHRFAFVLLLASGVAFAAEIKPDEQAEKKPGFFSRVTKGVTGIFTKDKPDEKAKEEKPKDKDTPPAKPKPKSDTPSKPAPEKKKAAPKKTDSDDKPKPKSEVKAAPKPAKPKETESKLAPKPEPEVAKKKEEPAPPKKAETKPSDEKPKQDSAATVKTEDKAPKDGDKKMKGDGGEFDDLASAFGTSTKPIPTPLKPEAKSVPAPSAAEALPAPPPLPASDGSWEIVKLDHDYVTLESIQRFYRFSTLKREGNSYWFRSPTIIMKATIGSQDLMINNIKFILSYAVAESKGRGLISRLDLCKLIDPVLLPSHITSSEAFDTVVIDAGHGGHDSGAKGVYGYEKDFTLQMALALRDACQKRGFKTVMTRSTDDFISLGGRVAIANATPRSIFVSLHFNSGQSSATGIETWALTPSGSSSTFMGSRGSDNSAFQGNRRDSENIALATAVHGMVIHRFKLVDRGIKRARWSVLTGCTRPGILFEGGFVTNGTDCRLIAAPTYRAAIVESIGDAIVNYRKALQPRVVQPSVK